MEKPLFPHAEEFQQWFAIWLVCEDIDCIDICGTKETPSFFDPFSGMLLIFRSHPSKTRIDDDFFARLGVLQRQHAHLR